MKSTYGNYVCTDKEIVNLLAKIALKYKNLKKEVDEYKQNNNIPSQNNNIPSQNNNTSNQNTFINNNVPNQNIFANSDMVSKNVVDNMLVQMKLMENDLNKFQFQYLKSKSKEIKYLRKIIKSVNKLHDPATANMVKLLYNGIYYNIYDYLSYESVLNQ